jgi:hypothetical protein
MEHAFRHEALMVPFETINKKDDKQILLSGKSYALNVKLLNMKIIALVII